MKPYFAFQWHITDQCDQRCRHCYIFQDPSHTCLSSASRQDMEAILANCLDFCDTFGRQPYFYLTGGDPLLHEDFWWLAQKLKGRSIPFSILGNPFHVDEKTASRLKSLGCEKYQMSLDGLEKTHDGFRMPGSFQATLEAIPVLKQAGLETAVMATVSKANEQEMPALMDVVQSAGADLFAFGRYCPAKPDESAMIAPADYRKLLDICDRKAQEWQAQGSATWFCRKDHLWTLFDYEKGRFIIPDTAAALIYGGCSCGNRHLTITADGKVMACRRVKDSVVGDTRADRLADLWLSEMEAYREYDSFSSCASCELLSWCRGCPAVARSMTGSFYGRDPQCWKAEKKEEVSSSSLKEK